jgi:hypothetical protein
MDFRDTCPVHLIVLHLKHLKDSVNFRDRAYINGDGSENGGRFVTKYVLTYNEPCQLSVLCGIISNCNELTAGVDGPLGVPKQMCACICTYCNWLVVPGKLEFLIRFTVAINRLE